MKLVILESPYKAHKFPRWWYTWGNKNYARRCMLHSLRQGESPMVSHLLYTQVLDDNNDQQRQIGIEAGLVWRTKAEKSVVYIDYDISEGMKYGIKAAKDSGVPVEFRKLKKPITFAEKSRLNEWFESL